MLVVGVALKIRSYARTPAPLKIPTTPAPTTASGVVLRLTREVVFFESLFKASKWTWLFGWLFHAALLLVLLRHLRYFQQPVWAPIVWIQPFGTYAGFALVRRPGRPVGAALPGRPRALHLDAVGPPAPGAAAGHRPVRAWACASSRTPTSSRVKAFMLGLMRLDIQPLPADPLLLLHLSLVALLMLIFPISKLLHAPGLFFSPTPQPGRQPARGAPCRGLGRGARQEVARRPWPPPAFDTPTLKPYPVIPLVAGGRDGAQQALRRLAHDPGGASAFPAN